MSILGYLLAFAPGLAAKVKIPREPPGPRIKSGGYPEDEVERLRERIGKLEYQLCTAENARDAAEAQLERHRAETALDQRWREHVAQAQMTNAQFGAQMALEAQQAQYNAMQEGSYYQRGLAQQNLLGAQGQKMPADWVCTCIPDRASALMPPAPGSSPGVIRRPVNLV
jgi:hypothetical protein